MTAFKAILFDMDGTLLDSEKLWRIAEGEFFERYSIQLPHEEHQALIGKEMTVVLATLKERFQLSEDLETLALMMRTRVKELLRDVQLMPGAAEMLDFVDQQQLARALVSNSSHDIIAVSLAAKPWAGTLEQRFSADDVEAAKPAPDIYQLAARTLNLACEDCLVLEDSLTGVKAARAAGMTCYAIPSEPEPDLAAFQQLTPHIFNDLFEVREQLEQNR